MIFIHRKKERYDATPYLTKKQNPHTINSGLQLWVILVSLAISAVVSVGVGVHHYYKFDEGTPRLVFILLMLLLWLGSFIIISIVISVWNNIALKNTIQKLIEDDSSPRHNTRVTLKDIEDNVHSSTDTTKVSKAFVNTQKNYQQYIDESYHTSVNEFNPNQFNFQTTEVDQPISKNDENISTEFIRKRLLEKETRIIRIVDINVEKKSNHLYDFSAKIYVLAESLTTAAEIVDSANTILEYEFNIKDTKLIPVISI